MRILVSVVAPLALTGTVIGVALPENSPSTPYPGGRQAAVALTYDDALVSQLDVAIPQLDAAGLKGTFFLMGRQVGSTVARWKKAAAAGHELGNHTINHPCAKGTYETPDRYTSEAYTVDTLLTEIVVMNGFLEALDGATQHAFATPCGHNLAGGQDYLGPLQRTSPAAFVRDPRTMPSTIRATGFVDASGEQMITWVESVREARAAGVIVFHGVGGDYLSVSGEAHRQLAAYLKAHEREIWTATFTELMKVVPRS
jgi:hypothetical protein